MSVIIRTFEELRVIIRTDDQILAELGWRKLTGALWAGASREAAYYEEWELAVLAWTETLAVIVSDHVSTSF